MRLKEGEISKGIFGSNFEVHNKLGYEFLEEVYQNVKLAALEVCGASVELESAIKVYPENYILGNYDADSIADGANIELGVCSPCNSQDNAQLLKEQNVIQSKLGLLIKFGREKVDFKRFISFTKYPRKSVFIGG